MDSPTYKFAIVLSGGLSCGVSINTAAHLAARLGTLVCQLGGGEVTDGSATIHSGIPISPNVILGASQDDLRSRLDKARSLANGSGLVVLDYPEQGNTTSTDDEYRAALAAAQECDLTYYGFLVYGPRKQVNEVTKGLTLWACGNTPFMSRP